MRRIMLLVIGWLVFLSPLLSVHAVTKVTVSDENISDFSEFQARTKKEFSSACYEISSVALGKAKSLENGAKFKVYTSAELSKLIKRLKRKRKGAPQDSPKRAALAAKVRSVKAASNRCNLDGGDGEDGDGENGDGDNGDGEEGGDGTMAQPGPDRPSIGTNVAWVNYYDNELKFVDLFKHSRELVAKWADGTGWDVAMLSLRDDGYPTHIPQTDPESGQQIMAATVVAFEDQGLQIPEGSYTLMFEGTGQVFVGGDGAEEGLFTQAGTHTIEVSNNSGGIWIDIRQSSQSDPIRNIRLIMPGHAETYQTKPFYPPFIALLKEFSLVRFMQTMNTTGGTYPCDNSVAATDPTCTKDWGLRTTMSHQTQGAARGPALEYLVDIANEAGVDIWVNIPHGATANYIREFAQLIHSRLNSNLRCYIEYSNEVFNPDTNDYPQRGWADANGRQLGLNTDTDFMGGQRFYAQRSLEMFEIFEEVWGSDKSRVIKLLALWIATPTENDQILEYFKSASVNPNGIKLDALATAPYFGFFIAPAVLMNDAVASTTVEQILDWSEQNVSQNQTNPAEPDQTEESILSLVQGNQSAADKHGVLHITYEGGSHVVDLTGFDGDTVLGDKLLAANRHQRMYTIYNTLLDGWFNGGGTVFVHFIMVQRYHNLWGGWGSVEYLGQPRSETHKLRALLERQAQLKN